MIPVLVTLQRKEQDIVVLKQKPMCLVLEGTGNSEVIIRTVVVILAMNDIQHDIWHTC